MLCIMHVSAETCKCRSWVRARVCELYAEILCATPLHTQEIHIREETATFYSIE